MIEEKLIKGLKTWEGLEEAIISILKGSSAFFTYDQLQQNLLKKHGEKIPLSTIRTRFRTLIKDEKYKEFLIKSSRRIEKNGRPRRTWKYKRSF